MRSACHSDSVMQPPPPQMSKATVSRLSRGGSDRDTLVLSPPD